MNRLAAEQSPYLRQHADNPVDWHPWGEEAFARARGEDKPIFLSIGYSTCHWCHVMAHESFESGELAEILNREFVSIKVDREERPDVDRVYMTFVQATTGSGGWPMSVWLTPELRPFYGGTYYPPTTKWGRPGFREVLLEIARAWREDRDNVVKSAAHITGRLNELSGAGARVSDQTPDEDALRTTVHQFQQAFDARRGGFGEAPKFPRPSELLFLLREHARTGDSMARDMVAMTLRAMALGGMRDHIGGGFHRYSVDGNWRVPHFEKMLYDQSQLVLAYLEAAQVTGDPFFADVANDTLAYVAREMTDSAGGFYSAEDADSVPPEAAAAAHAHKSEGAFYIWQHAEIRAALGEDSRAFELRFGILPDGNAPFDPQNEFNGKNLLYVARDIAEIARELATTPDAVDATLKRARQRLFEVRKERPRPHLDDKVLTGWNGLMIAAFARAARVLPAIAPTADSSLDSGESHLDIARRAAQFLRTTMGDRARNVLVRRYRAGEAAIDGYAEDYAFSIFGVLELFQADGNAEWLEWAMALQDRQDRLFWDATAAGWFSTTGDDASVLIRMKEDYDGAEPSASGVGAWNLLTLARLTGQPQYSERLDAVFRGFSHRLVGQGRTMPMMSAALSASVAAPEQIVVVGPRNRAETRVLWQAAQHRYRPFAHFISVDSGPAQDRLARLLPWIAGMSEQDGKAAAYVCRNFTCDMPITEAQRLQ